MPLNMRHVTSSESANPTASSSTAQPYLRVTWRGDERQCEVEGATQWLGGHRLPGASAGPDDGIYAGWSWQNGSLQAFNDRYGFYPLFYCHDDRQIILSPSLMVLLELGVSPEIDGPAMATFLRLGWFLGQSTPFRAIRVLPPSATFEWRAGKLKVEGRLPVVRPNRMTRDQAIDAYIEAFRHAVARRVPSDGTWAVPLSGGRDSRHILLELHHQGKLPPQTFTTHTYPVQHGDDVLCARALAEAVGAPHVTIPPPASILSDVDLRESRTHFCSLHHTWLVPVLRHMQSAGVRTIYDGLGGDVLSAGLFLTAELLAAMRKGDTAAAARMVLGRWSRNAGLERWFSPVPRQELREEVAVEGISADMQRHLEAPNPVAAFHFWSRTRRCIALQSFGLYREACTAFCPYLDHDVYDLLAGLPPEYFLDHTFHTETIARAYPDFVAVPYASYRPKRSRWSQAAYGGDVLWRALKVRPTRITLVGYWFAAVLLRLRHRHLEPDTLLYLLSLEHCLDRLR